MFKKISIIFSIMLLISTPASAILIDFESNIDPNNDTFPINSYEGFDWSTPSVSMSVLDASIPLVDGTGYETLDPDGHVAFNDWGHDPATIRRTDGNVFDFISADFTVAWDGQTTIKIDAYDSNNNLINNIMTEIYRYNVTHVTALFEDVQYLLIYTPTSGSQWVIDNFEYEITNTAPVPEPATMILFGLGLIGFGGYHIKRRNNE